MTNSTTASTPKYKSEGSVKIHLRFNHQHNGSGLVWRVFADGAEFQVTGFRIDGPVMHDEITVEAGVTKWNVACTGVLRITDDFALVTPN